MKIAAFVGQIYMYTQKETIKGIYEECKKNGDELHLFSFYVSNDEGFDLGEYEFIKRMDMSGYDKFIVYLSAFYNPYIRSMLVSKLKGLDKSIVSIDSFDKDFINITSCNMGAMEQLVEHVVSVHGVKTVNYIGGPSDSNDAIERLRACRRVLGRHGLNLNEDRIYEGNYYVDSGYKAYDYFKRTGKLDCDAFICVNDQTAMGVFYRATEDGYRIPDDFIITGFDHIPQAAYNEPSISSVERFERLNGKKAYELAMDPTDEEIKMEPHIALGSSCCPECAADPVKRTQFLRDSIKMSMDNSRYAGYVSDCSADFMAYRSSEEMYDMLPSYQRKFNIPSMCIVLDPNKDSDTLEIPYRCNLDDNWMVSTTIRRNEIFHDNGEGNLYIYSSLHYGDSYYGYVVTTNYEDAMENELYRMFINNISNMYESVKKYNAQEEYIHKLKDLSYYDPLTKLYNRLGFFARAEAEFELAKDKGQTMYIIFADLDRLKVINDSMGHKMGDSYIVDFARILSNGIEADDIVMRFGGDEFVVFGTSRTEDAVKAKITAIQEAIREFNTRGKYSPYILGVSMGYSMISPDTEKSLFSFIEAADGKMYKTKKAKKESRSGTDRRSGRDRRVSNRRGINEPLNLT